MAKVVGSGIKSRSDSLIGVHPSIELPSNGNPFTKDSFVISSAGTLSWWSRPKGLQNCNLIHLTPDFLIWFTIFFADVSS